VLVVSVEEPPEPPDESVLVVSVEEPPVVSVEEPDELDAP